MRKFYVPLLFFIVAGCAQLGLEPAKSFSEQVSYVEATAQGTILSLQVLTCRGYTPAGVCTETGRPLHPARSLGYLNTISNVRSAAKAAASMSNGVGECLGQPSTQTACLALANVMLNEVTKILTDLEKKGTK